jgi:hypothetical protein
MRHKPIARIVVPSLAEYPREVIQERLPEYRCQVVEYDYLIRPALIATQEEDPCEGQGMSVVAVLDSLYQERQSSLARSTGGSSRRTARRASP